MRKPSRQGVPKRKPRETATPIGTGTTKEAPQIAPKAAARAPVPEPEAMPDPVPELVVEPEPVSATPAPVEPQAPPAVEPDSRPVPTPSPAPSETPPLSVRELTARVDAGWAAFRSAAFSFPAEHMNDHLTEHGWTRKQMLAHIAAWHDLTSDRIVKLALTGRPSALQRDTDAINALAARVAIGKTAGEVLEEIESTFNRLRRQMVRLTDEQLRVANAWAAQVIAGNTYEHYAEHFADLAPPESLPGSGARR